jgi:hypothetical protein
MDISTDKELILQALLEVPDSSLLQLCNTEDRKDKFNQCKSIYQCIHDALSKYFMGEEWEGLGLDKTFKEYIDLQVDYYLALYKIIWRGWCYIKRDWERVARYLDEKELLIKRCLNSPGELMRLIFEEDAVLSLSTLFPEWTTGNSFSSYSPRKVYLESTKYEKLFNKFNSGELSKAEFKKLSSLVKKKHKRYKETIPFQINNRVALAIIIEMGEGKSRSLPEAIAEWDRVTDEI